MLNYEVLKPGGTFKGKGYKDWIQDWSNWFYLGNPDQHNNGDVIFLRSVSFHDGVYSKKPNVMVGDDALEISDRHWILVPIITANSVSYEVEDTERMFNFVRSHISKGDNPPELHQVMINGIEIDSTKLEGGGFDLYEFETPLFPQVIPEDSKGPSLKDYGEYAVETGTYQAVTRGFFILLRFIPDIDQQKYSICCNVKGAFTERGDYNASHYYQIIVNKSEVKSAIKSTKRLSHKGPNRMVKIEIEEKFAKNEIGPQEYLEIMNQLGVPEEDQRFGWKAQNDIHKHFPNQTNQGDLKKKQKR